MAMRNIVKEGDPILNKVCRPVTDFGPKLAVLLDDMKETLLDAQGLGLAGPQVGMMRRLCIVIDLPEDDDGTAPEEGQEPEYEFIELVNPEILEVEGSVGMYEGCLSFPGHNGWVERPEKVTVKFFDRNGEEQTITRVGMTARCICHECDHLDGVTIMQRATKFYEDEYEDEE